MTPRVIVEPARLAGLSLLRCQTDERLVDLARAGNERAFEAIVDRYRRPLLRYCARLLPPTRAEDVVQQAFLNAYAGMLRDDRRIELRPWLYRIAHNAALNALRENGWSHERIESVLAGTDTTHEEVERRASLQTVLHAVQMLPERQRDAMILREIEGRSYAQIAIELDATGGAVRQLLHRARHTVRAAATALTPTGLLTRLPLGGTVAERVSDAAVQESLRTGAGRVAGGIVAAVAVAAGLSEAPNLRLPIHHSRPRASVPRHDAAQASAVNPTALARTGGIRIERAARPVAEVTDGSAPGTLRALVPADARAILERGDAHAMTPRTVPGPMAELPGAVAPRAVPSEPAPAQPATPATPESRPADRHRHAGWRASPSRGDSRGDASRQPPADSTPSDGSGGQSGAQSDQGQSDPAPTASSGTSDPQTAAGDQPSSNTPSDDQSAQSAHTEQAGASGDGTDESDRRD